MLDAKFSYRGEDLVATLQRVCATVGVPKVIRVDQGSEFISRDNKGRPHGAIGNKVLAALMKLAPEPSPVCR